MAAFTPGNIVIYRVGDGTSSLVNTGNAVFLDEYTPSGTLVQSIALPTADSGTNQTLIAVCCAIQLSWLGTSGLRELAVRCARGTRYCRDGLLAVEGIEPLVDGPVLREFAVRTPLPGDSIVERMADEGFLAGIPVADNGLLVAVTEKRTREEIDAYVAAFEKVVR